MTFVDFCWNFPWFWLIFATRIRIRFIEAGPDPADQKADPNGSVSETLKISFSISFLVENSVGFHDSPPNKLYEVPH